MHVHNAHMRRFHVLRSPVISGAAVDNIPTKIIYRDNLRRHGWLLDDGPLRFPSIAILYYVQFDACLGGAANDGSPMQFELISASLSEA
jgi:hypothetical protein